MEVPEVAIGDSVRFNFLEEDSGSPDYGTVYSGCGDVIDMPQLPRAKGGSSYVVVDDGESLWMLDPVEIVEVW